MTQRNSQKPSPASRAVASLLALALVWAPSHALADEPECAESDARNCQQTLPEGDPAAFTGVLLSPRKLALLVAQAEQVEARVALARAEAKEILELTVQTYEARLRLVEETGDMEKKLLRERLEEVQKLVGPAWYEHPVFVAALTAMTTVALFIATAQVVQAAAIPGT